MAETNENQAVVEAPRDGPPESAGNGRASAEGDDSVVVVSRAELLASLTEVRSFLEEYGRLIDKMGGSKEWNQEALALVRSHHALSENGDSPPAKLHLVVGLFHYLLRRVNQEQFNFKISTRVGLIPESEDAELAEFSLQFKRITASMERLVSQVAALAEMEPANSDPRLRGLLQAISSFLKGIVRQDWEDVALFLTHINLITASAESHELVGHIAKIARSIYDSLNEFSGFFGAEDLSHSTDELPDAVINLKSVISRLEDAANTNLDTLEGLNLRLNESMGWFTESQQALAECGQEIQRLRNELPQMAGQLDAVHEILQKEMRGDLQTLEQMAQAKGQTYLSMIANQSFQDLTGQTLKKVIAFIEELQFKMVQLLPNYSPKTVAAVKDAPEEAGQENAGGTPVQSQDQVDQMLADLGF